MACCSSSVFMISTSSVGRLKLLQILAIIMMPMVPLLSGAGRTKGDAADSYSKYFSALGNDLGGIVDKVASTLDSFDFSGSNDCTHKCPYGHTVQANPAYTPTVNGCGSFGIEINLHDLPQLTKCCNAHDVCYDTCGEKKSVCDRELQRCAQKVCLKASKYETMLIAQEACNALGEMLYKTTSMLGCEPYKSAQRKACTCIAMDYRGEL